MEKQYEELAKVSSTYAIQPCRPGGQLIEMTQVQPPIAHFPRILIFIGEISWGRNPSPYGPYSLTP
jgi:hypothetical protein